VEFEWDLSKEVENLQKHGIAFAEAIETFSDPGGFQLSDMKHSEIETRFFWVGKSASGKILTTRFTKRGDNIRIFGSASWESLRGFTMKEQRLNDLVIDHKGTQQIRRKMTVARSVKITINIDKSSLIFCGKSCRNRHATRGLKPLLNRRCK
jgi:uncharacterized DUF497 family protein